MVSLNNTSLGIAPAGAGGIDCVWGTGGGGGPDGVIDIE